MSKKIVAAVAAGAILVVAGLVFSLVTFPGIAGAQEGDSSDDPVASRALGFLERVLDELVSEGTIDQEDAEAVLAAVEEEIEGFNEEHPEWEHSRRHLLRKGARIGALLDDGGITQEEFDSLPEESRLRQLDLEEALADDLITPEELREVLREHRRG